MCQCYSSVPSPSTMDGNQSHSIQPMTRHLPAGADPCRRGERRTCSSSLVASCFGGTLFAACYAPHVGNTHPGARSPTLGAAEVLGHLTSDEVNSNTYDSGVERTATKRAAVFEVKFLEISGFEKVMGSLDIVQGSLVDTLQLLVHVILLTRSDRLLQLLHDIFHIAQLPGHGICSETRRPLHRLAPLALPISPT